ncbi:hypothetical protein K491DRAFT_766110 [Lophiostoma macrostomum CBS 122681]|uniref:RING-CH-type domain-containing protein n=1 Tax=Lophiostoma macrostomum CBS 122681 TaxID=1314788 RepID=A0A6A6TKG5_9PLEO|nr:hypothetical protein K491DRAFT_766110 [Lophiostoma macrostomum CBS 122681]
MSSSGFEAMPGWYWPDDVPREPSAGAPTTPPPPRTANADESSRADPGSQSSRRRRHWPPRQCRICLETVQPTTHVPSESLPGFMQSPPNVTYEDENGRLIRPCMCKGSSKYVHDACLQAWRHADPGYGRRNYWQCPTCGFKYRLARLGWGQWVASTSAQVALTVIILLVTVFLLGFVADPIISIYFDPWSFLSPWSSTDYYYDDDEAASWIEHFVKGFTSMGVIGFLKVIFAQPFAYFRFGGGSRGRAATGRDRMEQVGWIIILIGVATFLTAIYKAVRAWSRRTLQRAGERVMDVQGDEEDDDDDEAT